MTKTDPASIVVPPHWHDNTEVDNAIAELTARVAALEAAAPTPPPTTAIYGFASAATGGAGTGTIRVTTVSQFLTAIAGSNRIISMAPGTYNLTAITYVRGDNVTIEGDAIAPGVTITGYPIWVADGATNVILRNLRHRGGLDVGESGDCFVASNGSSLLAFVNLSASGYSDEGLDSWTDNHDITWQDCIVGPGRNPAHNFAHLIGNHSYNLSIFRTLYHSTMYRNPAVGWDDNTSALSPQAIVGDVGNVIAWNYTAPVGSTAYGTSIYYGAKANVRNSLYKGGTRAGEAVDVMLGAQMFQSGNLSRDNKTIRASNVGSAFPVPTAAVLPLLPVQADNGAALIAAIKANAGCRPLDAEDTAALAALT